MGTKAFLLAVFLVVLCNFSVQADIQWMYDSPLTVLETISDIGGGEYLYEYSFTNVDTSPIWNFGVYTTFSTEPVSDFDNYDWLFPYHMPRGSSPYDSSNLDMNIIQLTGSSYEGGVGGDPSKAILTNDFATGFSFSSDVYDYSFKYYFYCTIDSGSPWNNGIGEVAAVGLTIPEPFSILFIALGGLLSLKRIRKK